MKKILQNLGLLPVGSLNITNYSIRYDDLGRSEKILRDFVLDQSNIVSWTNYSEGPLSVNWLKDKRFLKRMDEWQAYFVKEEVDNIEYGEIIHKRKRFHHYHFRLGGELRDLIEREGITLTFPGFWDPVYYKDEKLVASVVAHEAIINLSLTSKQTQQLDHSDIFDKG